MLEKFLNEIKENAEKHGLSDAATVAVAEKYKRRFALALEAGFTESEAINKFGSPEKIVEDAVKAEEAARNAAESCDKNCENCGNAGECAVDNAKNDAENGAENDADACYGDNAAEAESYYAVIADEFCIENRSDNVDVFISSGDEPGVKTVLDGNVGDYYKAELSDDGLKYEFTPRDESVLKKNKATGSVHIVVDKRMFFKRVEISAACGGDFDSSDYDFNADEFTGDFVAGDAKFGDITAKNCKINGVSGDCFVKKIKAASCSVSMVSGDCFVDEIVTDSLSVNTVSGDIAVKGATVKTAKNVSVSGDILLDGDIKAYTANTVSGDISVNSKIVCENLANKVSRSLGNFFKSFGKGSDKNDD